MTILERLGALVVLVSILAAFVLPFVLVIWGSGPPPASRAMGVLFDTYDTGQHPPSEVS
jgi:hypothetical protein